MIRKALDNWVEWLCLVLMAVLAVDLMLGVFSRYALFRTFTWYDEIARACFVWVVFLGAAVGVKRGSHFGLHLLIDMARARAPLAALVTPPVIIAFSTVLSSKAGVPGVRAFPATPRDGHLQGMDLRRHADRWPLDDPLQPAGPVAHGAERLIAIAVTSRLSGSAPARRAGCFLDRNGGFPWLWWSGSYPLTVIVQQAFLSVDLFVLLAIPLFILAGSFMETGGIAVRLVRFAQALVGWIRGGLAMAVVVAEYIFSGISGSTIADVSAIGSTMIPPMVRAGYKPEQAVSIVAAASAMGILVPPCILMIVIGAIANVSVAALFIGGLLPAVVLALALMGYIYYDASRGGMAAPQPISLREVWVELRACAHPARTAGNHLRRNPGRGCHADGSRGGRCVLPGHRRAICLQGNPAGPTCRGS